MHHPSKFLLLHGAGGTRSKWRRLLQTEVGSECIAVDLPGHGSNHGLVPKTISDYAAIISSDLAEDVVVVGHSMGGLIGIELAAMNPHVRGLVLVASHARLPVGESVLTALQQGEFPDGLFYASYAKSVDPGLLEEERGELGLVSSATAHTDFAACHAYDGELTFSRLDIPILAVYGAQDRLLPKDAKTRLQTLNTHVMARDIPQCGHYIMLERPEELADALQSFGGARRSR
ncbi:alpha/beta fold hydrolase [Alicyclobacillus sp. ALC3]|uniref:alpha/beta fold hydrolase n=1 Tax=Alicyclobacillus sp. ALC3 TaxID=2796143 RepID=UPI002378D6BE|nr:alpha/beta fold hydrolase [Alicyclobacillus sp. ALC3]WDL95503.1 alpha/beta fold hydrolase [Alicyclobacillus sp. ALC3]